MRHQKKTVKLGRTAEHRKALLANQVCSLIKHQRIKTTLAKAKAVRPLAEKMVTLGKKNSLHARRTALAVLRQKEAVKDLFEKIAPRTADRKGRLHPHHQARPAQKRLRSHCLPGMGRRRSFHRSRSRRGDRQKGEGGEARRRDRREDQGAEDRSRQVDPRSRFTGARPEASPCCCTDNATLSQKWNIRFPASSFGCFICGTHNFVNN